MNTQFSQNVQPPAGWTVQTYIDATGKVQVGHTFSPVWPFSVYPPLPPGHPMSVPASTPPGLPYGVPSHATVMGPVHAVQKSPPPRSSNQSPVDIAAAAAPVYTTSSSSSYAPPASWSQPHAGSVYPPAFPPQWYNMYGGYYYTHNPLYQGSVYPPAVLPSAPLSNDVANVPPTIQPYSSVSSKASKTTASPAPQEDPCCRKQPTGVASLPATYEFTFKCSSQLDLQQCCSPQRGQDGHEHSQDTLLTGSPWDELNLPCSEPAQETSELPFDDMETFQRLLDEFTQQEDSDLPQQETSSLPCEVESFQDDETAAQLIWSILTASQGQQDATGDVTVNSFSELRSSASPAPSTSSSEMMSGSTLASTWFTVGSSSKTDSSSLPHSLPQPGMFSPEPSTQTTSGDKGKKRSMEPEPESEPENSESSTETHEPKRRRGEQEGDGSRQYWCTTCSGWVSMHRRKIHERNRKHSGRARFSCRICSILGVINSGHSRKDSLKRHIIQQHHHQFGHIWQTFPQLLEPYIPGEDLGYLSFLLAPAPPPQ